MGTHIWLYFNWTAGAFDPRKLQSFPLGKSNKPALEAVGSFPDFIPSWMSPCPPGKMESGLVLTLVETPL